MSGRPRNDSREDDYTSARPAQSSYYLHVTHNLAASATIPLGQFTASQEESQAEMNQPYYVTMGIGIGLCIGALVLVLRETIKNRKRRMKW